MNDGTHSPSKETDPRAVTCPKHATRKMYPGELCPDCEDERPGLLTHKPATVAVRHDFSLIRGEFTSVELEDGTFGWSYERVVEHADGSETSLLVWSGAVDSPLDILVLAMALGAT